MEKKLNRQELKQLVERSIRLDDERKRIGWGATSSVSEVMWDLNSSYDGLNSLQVQESRMVHGENKITPIGKRSFFKGWADRLERPTCHLVRRENQWVTIPAKELVVGDVVRLNEGEVVPADLRVLETDHLIVDESVIERDRRSVKKKAGICLGQMEKETDYFNIVLRGSNVLEGSAKAVVLSVGDHTILGTKS